MPMSETDEQQAEDVKAEADKPQSSKKGLKFAALFALVLISLFAGSLAGTALVQKFPVLGGAQQAESAAFDKAMADLRKSQSSQSAKLNRLEQALDKIPSENNDQKLSQLEARLNSLETNQLSISEIETRIAALEAGIVATEGGFDFSDFERRLKALENSKTNDHEIEAEAADGTGADLSAIETRITALEDKLSSQEMTEEAGDYSLQDIEARIAALEQSVPNELPDVPAALAPLLVRLDALEVKANAAPLLIPPFPKQAVLDAMVEAGSEEKGNWFQRVVDSQITVVDETHIETVNDITKLVEEGDVKSALKKIETLPGEAQDAAAAWVDAVTIQDTE